uniref:alpha-galactosidase n=1 Tax=Arundo donax TaxID=35708 RepID=A0A0A8XVW8_ARUDO
MALWSMAKSPLMYGGDLRHLDSSTLSIITNPTLLKINHYSTNNKEYHYVYVERTSNGEHSDHLRSPYHVRLRENDGMVIGLTACSDEKANGWYMLSQDGKPDHICRNYEIQNDKNISFCLGKTEPRLESDVISICNMEYQAKFHLAVTNTDDACLDASASRRRTASENKFLMFSRCRWHAKQIWELNEKGNLVSSYSRLCATMESRNDGTTGARAWVATGSKGEIYLAFFNLDPTSRKMTARISELEKVLGRTFVRKHLCSCTEVWSGKNFGLVKEEISAVVNSHGSTVFEIMC